MMYCSVWVGTVQFVLGESVYIITAVWTSNKNQMCQSFYSSVSEVSSDVVYLPDVHVD